MKISSPHVWFTFAALIPLFLGCSKSETQASSSKLMATADMLDEQGKKIGSAELRQTATGVEIDMEVTGLKPGEHALHIHNVGDCHTPGAEGKAFTAAGPHFNPYNKKHGLENPEGPHAGDLPNFSVSADGKAKVKRTATLVTLEEGKVNSLFQTGGTCLMIHAAADDNKTDPTGNSGDRVACGVIRKR